MSTLRNQFDRASEDVVAVLRESQLRSEVLLEARRRRATAGPLDSRAFLAERPELRSLNSVVLGLAYEEYCQELEAGKAVDPDSFCRRFPGLEKTLRGLISIHDFLEAHPEVAEKFAVAWPERGEIVAGFNILAELGRGAFARVYLAEEIALGDRRVAIKIGCGLAAEAEILGKLQHPGIVPVYSVWRQPGGKLTVICMPYLGRMTLHDLLEIVHAGQAKPRQARDILRAVVQRGGPALHNGTDGAADGMLRHGSFVDGAVHLGCQMAEALAYAHGMGICHSDLKPTNVLMGPGGRPMLLDFNLAFELTAARHLWGGTLVYMAAEQLQSIGVSATETPPIGPPADVFALGVMLYELLSGRLPFGLPTDSGSVEQAKEELLPRQQAGPTPLREANPEVDAALAAIVESCLAVAPQDRPTAEALSAALRRSNSRVRRARRWAGQHRGLVGLSVVLLAALVLAAGAFFGTREPYSVRELQHALRSYRRAEYAQAEASLTRLVDADKGNAAAWFWRARTRQKQGQPLLAVDDYGRAADLAPAGQIYACQAYCYALERDYAEAIRRSNKAIRAGFKSAELYNNLGYCYSCQGRYADAVRFLDEALRLKPRLRPALHNRACAEHNWAGSDTQHRLNPRALTDIEMALQGRPLSGYLFLDAARIYARAGDKGPPDRERIHRYLSEAVRLGSDPEVIRRVFANLFEPSTLEALLAEAKPAKPRPVSLSLVDPMFDDAFSPR